MAKRTKEGPSKSDSIRAYLAENPKAGPTAVVQALKEQGIDVSIPLVSAIKGKSRKRRGRKAGPGKAGSGKTGSGKTRKTRSGPGNISFEMLLAAKKMAEHLGGVEKAREAIDLLARLELS